MGSNGSPTKGGITFTKEPGKDRRMFGNDHKHQLTERQRANRAIERDRCENDMRRENEGVVPDTTGEGKRGENLHLDAQ